MFVLGYLCTPTSHLLMPGTRNFPQRCSLTLVNLSLNPSLEDALDQNQVHQSPKSLPTSTAPAQDRTQDGRWEEGKGEIENQMRETQRLLADGKKERQALLDTSYQAYGVDVPRYWAGSVLRY